MPDEKKTISEISDEVIYKSSRKLITSLLKKDAFGVLVSSTLLLTFWKAKCLNRLQLIEKKRSVIRTGKTCAKPSPVKQTEIKIEPELKQEIAKKDPSFSKIGLKPGRIDIFLIDVGENKLMFIRTVRSLTSLSLPEIKELIERPPPTLIIEGVDFSDAKMVLEMLKEIGVTVELKASLR